MIRSARPLRPSSERPCRIIGNPAASVPAGFTPEGLPVGLQIVGCDKQDFSVLQLAHAFEQATNFGRRRPKIAV
jgi:amidase